MKKFILLTSVAAFSLVSGIAAAATIKNTDKDEITLHVTVDGKTEAVKLKSGESYDSKGKDISYLIGHEKSKLTAKAADAFEIKNGKAEIAQVEAPKDTAAPAAGEAMTPVEKKVTLPKTDEKK